MAPDLNSSVFFFFCFADSLFIINCITRILKNDSETSYVDNKPNFKDYLTSLEYKYL